MKLSIVYDNEANKGFISDWGFSCSIETGDWHILFDTGASGEILVHNLQRLGIHKEDIDIITLSHKHWDHTGGLRAVMHPGVAVCLPSSFPLSFKKYIAKKAARVVEVSEPKEIVPGVYTTGELRIARLLTEQSLVLKRKGGEGVVVVTGCGHPGLDKIFEAAKVFGTLYGVIGGFHGFDKLELLHELEVIVPCHGTIRKKEIVEMYPEKVVRCGAGMVLEI